MTREIRWGLRDSSLARIGPASDTSVYVIGIRPGQTTLTASAIADPDSNAGAAITVAGT